MIPLMHIVLLPGNPTSAVSRSAFSFLSRLERVGLAARQPNGNACNHDM